MGLFKLKGAQLVSSQTEFSLGMRYKLLGADALRNLPALEWRVRGVLPAEGLARQYGSSASGKSFLALDMAASATQKQVNATWLVTG